MTGAHEHVWQAVSARLDGELDTDQAFLLSCHLDECADCRAVAEAFEKLTVLAREALVPEDPAPFEAAVAALIAAEPPGARPAAAPRAAHGDHAPAAGPPGPPPVRQRPTRRPARRARLGRRLAMLGAAALLGLSGLVAVDVFIPSTTPGPYQAGPSSRPSLLPRQVALADVLTRAERVAAEIRTLTGSVKISGREHVDGVGGTLRFAYAQPDRLWVEGADPDSMLKLRILDGPNAREVSWFRGDPHPLVRQGRPLVSPQDQDALAPLASGFGWYGAQLQDAQSPARPQLRDGREVFVLELRRERTYEEITGPPRFTHYEVWVDATTYLPVRIQAQDRREAGKPRVVEDARFTYDQVNGEVPASAFAVPKDARRDTVPGQKSDFKTMSLDQAQERAGYAVTRVGKLPGDGWGLLRAGYATEGRITGAEGGNPGGHDLVV